MRIWGRNCHLGRALQRVGCHRTLWAQWCQQKREIMAETWAENPGSVPKSAHSCALWTAPLGFFPVSLRPAAPSYLESQVLQSAAKAVKRPPSKRRRKSHPLLFHNPGRARVWGLHWCGEQGRPAHGLLGSVVPSVPVCVTKPRGLALTCSDGCTD